MADENKKPAMSQSIRRSQRGEATASATSGEERKASTDNSPSNSDDQHVTPDDADIKEEPKTTKYVVTGGSIFTENGKARAGETVELTEAEARSFNRLGRLKPYIDGDEG